MLKAQSRLCTPVDIRSKKVQKLLTFSHFWARQA